MYSTAKNLRQHWKSSISFHHTHSFKFHGLIIAEGFALCYYVLNCIRKTYNLALKLTITMEKEPMSNSEEKPLSFGDRMADKIADFGGSWTFILSFMGFLLVWISFNIYWLSNKGFDPYPFILLNLILSCIAALQAPVIMMSQNRQEEKDRERAKEDLKINQKAEEEIRSLHIKLDLLIKQHEEFRREMRKTE